MRARARRRVRRGAALLLLVLLTPVVAAGLLWLTRDADSSKGASEHEIQTSSDFSHPRGRTDWPGREADSFNAEVSLDDGRRVVLYFVRGKGLVEQHYSPGARAWSRPALLHRSKTEPCSAIDLRAESGTVTAIADLAMYCDDGEPPTEALAAVATGDLQDWDLHLLQGYDGWQDMTTEMGGRHVEFTTGGRWLSWYSLLGFVDAGGL